MSRPVLLGLSGSVRRPSRTTALVGALLDALATATGGEADRIELVDAAPVLFRALHRAQLDDAGREVIARVEEADLLVVGTPVHRASVTGALKHLFDLVHHQALRGRPVILAATGGTPLHGLMIEHQMRPLFGFFGALTLPTAVYALETDVEAGRIVNPAIHERIARAAAEAARFLPTSHDDARAGERAGTALEIAP
ncbi:FMN reductase [Marinivivus vitaminiproducens]|uniref:FMN reductase n=1 Tax=Marinivivus vitaminiproducens TaxID=3035935 RepID=UPI00279B8DF3|nr:FMN reductase [Geminicoccaceae bacterium SCSIO 64248]